MSTIRNIYHSLIESKSEIIASIVLITISLLPNLVFIFWGSTLSDSISKQIGFFLISLILVIFPFIFFKKKAAFLFNGIFLLLAPLEIGSIILTKLPITAGYILMIFQTNFNETWEFISSFSALLTFLVITYCGYFILVFKYIKNEYFLAKQKRRLLLLGNLFVIILLYVYCFTLSINNYKPDFKKVFNYSNDIFLLKFNIIFPIDAINSVIFGFKLHEDLSSISEEKSRFIFHAKHKETIANKEIYVLVIGETARYSSLSINKYSRKTTPLLEKINSLVSYNNVFSEANNTETSLPILITRANALNFEVKNKEKSVVAAFREAGFNTYWIGNQSFGDLFIQQCANEANEYFFTSKDFDYADSYDQILWRYLDEILKKNEQKQFIVIHTLGSHFRYNFRYPSSFNIFKPSFNGAFGYDLINKSNKQLLINTYDNSILYTDFFLANTIKKLNKVYGISFLYYISDHGENLYEKDIVLHGGEQPTKFDVHVPLIVWTSEKYNRKFPYKINQIRANINKKISSSITFHSLLDMANISLNDENPYKSIANSQLKSDSVRYLLNSRMKVISFK